MEVTIAMSHLFWNKKNGPEWTFLYLFFKVFIPILFYVRMIIEN